MPSATVVVAVFRQAGANAVEVSKRVRGPAADRSTPSLPPSIDITPIYDRSRQHRQSRQRRAGDAVHRLRAGGAGDLRVPGPRHRHADSRRRAAAVAAADVHRDVGAGLQPGQPLADGADAGDRVPGGRCDRVPGEHRPPDGRGRKRASRRRFNSASEISFTILAMTISLAAVFLPLVFMPGLIGRIFREFSVTIVVAIFAIGHRLADADAADVLALARASAGTGRKKTLDRADHRRRRAPRARRLRPIAHLVSAAPLDLGGHLGRLPGRHDLPVHAMCPRRSCRVGDSGFICGRDDRPGRRFAAADARRTRIRPTRSCRHNPTVAHDVHHDRQRPVPAVQHGLAAGVP